MDRTSAQFVKLSAIPSHYYNISLISKAFVFINNLSKDFAILLANHTKFPKTAPKYQLQKIKKIGYEEIIEIKTNFKYLSELKS